MEKSSATNILALIMNCLICIVMRGRLDPFLTENILIGASVNREPHTSCKQLTLSSEEDAPTKHDERRGKALMTVTFRTTKSKPKQQSRLNTTKAKYRMTSARPKTTKVQFKTTPVRPIPTLTTSRTTQQLASVMSSTPANDSVILSATPTHAIPSVTVIPTPPLPGVTPTH